MNKLYKRPHDELRELLKDKRIEEYNRKSDPKPRLSPERFLSHTESSKTVRPRVNFQLELTSDLAVEDYGGIITLLWDTQVI